MHPNFIGKRIEMEHYFIYLITSNLVEKHDKPRFTIIYAFLRSWVPIGTSQFEMGEVNNGFANGEVHRNVNKSTKKKKKKTKQK
ncbi:hypothetical protein CsSME_00011067 [Camellia sinensis var. sinensis]